MNSIIFFIITFIIILAIIFGLIFLFPPTRKIIGKQLGQYATLIITVILIIGSLLIAGFMTWQFQTNQDFISGFQNRTPQSVLDDYSKIIIVEENAEGNIPKLSEEEIQRLEDLGTGVSFPLIGASEDFGIKNAAESFRRLHQAKPLTNWEVVSQGEGQAEGELRFVNPDNPDDISTAKIFMQKEKHLGITDRWQIDKVQTPEDLGACFAFLTAPANKLIPCFVQRIREIPSLFRQFTYLVRKFYNENLSSYISDFRFDNPFN